MGSKKPFKMFMGSNDEDVEYLITESSRPLSSAEKKLLPLQIVYSRLPPVAEGPYPDPYTEFLKETFAADFEFGNNLFFVTPKHATAKYNSAAQGLKAAFDFYDSISLDESIFLVAALNGGGQKDIIPFVNKLASLAISKPIEKLKCKTRDGQQLAYYAWLGRGRKDEESPFTNKVTTAGPISHALLPNITHSEQCAHCGARGQLQDCAGCLVKEHDHVMFKTSYCSKECQVAGWKNHRAFCRDMQRLSRATSLFQDLFIDFLGKSFHDTLEGISEKNGVLVAKYNKYATYVSQSQAASTSSAHDATCPSEVAKAVLMASQGNVIATTCKELLKMLLGDNLKHMWRATFVPKNAHWVVKQTECDGLKPNFYNSLWLHEVIRLTTWSGVDIAFDPTGAQFGWRELISPWSAYREHRMLQYIPLGAATDTGCHGNLRSYLLAEGNLTSKEAWGAIVGKDTLMKDMVAALKGEISSITEDDGMSKILALKQPDFEQARGRLLAAASEAISAKAAHLWASIPKDSKGNISLPLRSDRSQKKWFGYSSKDLMQNCPPDMEEDHV